MRPHVLPQLRLLLIPIPLLFGCPALAAAGLAEGLPRLPVPDRKDGLISVAIPEAGRGFGSAAGVAAGHPNLYTALRDAKRAGDEAAARVLHDALGTGGESETEMRRVDDLCQRVARTELRDPPRRWEEDVLVTNPSWSSGNPAMYAQGSGRVWVAAEDLNGPYIDIYYSDTDGLMWTYYTSLYTTGEDPTRPAIVIGEGIYYRLLVAYEYGRDTPNAAIHVYWEDLLSHEYATMAVESSPLVANPQLCVDSPETPVWYPYLIYVKGVIGDRTDYSNVHFTRSFTYGSSWETPTVLATQTTADNRPDIDFGGDYLYAVYTRTYSSEDRDTYVRRSSNYGGSWSTEVPLGYSSDDEYDPRVAATNGGNAVAVAQLRQDSPTQVSIDSYSSTNGGDSWDWSALPTPDGISQGLDLCASYEYGFIHAAFTNAANVYFTKAPCGNPTLWSNMEHVNDTGQAVGTDRVAVAANPRRQVDECVAWSDSRSGDNRWIYFDAAYHLGEYVIIDGTDSYYGELAPLIDWKRSLGYSVTYVMRADILNEYPTGDLGQRIWSWLADRRLYLRYVLLVGEIAQIPMRLLYPDGGVGDGGGFGSDYYYAKLSNPLWDRDGDWRWGEFTQDALDLYPDVIVGRIPFSHPTDIHNLVQNTIAYEQDSGAWKKNMMLAHGFMNHPELGRYETDCAGAADRIIEDFLDPYDWTNTTLYEWGGINPSGYMPQSTDSLCQAHFDIYTGIGQQGVINCMAHGNTKLMCSHQWIVDLNNDGYKTERQEYGSNYFSQRFRIGWDPVSALVFLCGCNTGVVYGTEPAFGQTNPRSWYLYTIQHNSTAMLRYLETGAPAVIGASAGSDYMDGWTHHTHGGTQSLNYYFYYYLVSHRMRAGDAFQAAVLYHALAHDPIRGIRDFNYFGDPSLEVARTSGRRWNSNGFAVGALPPHGPVYASGSAMEPASSDWASDRQRDDDPTIWWNAGEIDDAQAAGALLRTRGGVIYVGADRSTAELGWEGTVFRSTNNGETWEETGGMVACRSVNCLAETDTGTLLAGGLAEVENQYYGVIYRSSDAGESWEIVLAVADEMVFDLAVTGAGDIWAASGWNGAVYRSGSDGAVWELGAFFGEGVHVRSIVEASTGRLFAALGGETYDKVLWSDDGIAWHGTTGLTSVVTAFDMVECCGRLFLGVCGLAGGEVYTSDLAGNSWSPSGPLPAATLLSVRSLCAAAGGRVFAGGEETGGRSHTKVFAWQAATEQWLEFGGLIDPAKTVHALVATEDLVFAGTGDELGYIYKHILPAAATVDHGPTPGRISRLEWSHANPTLGRVDIRCILPEPSPLSVRIYDAAGRLRRTLEWTEIMEAGSHSIRWDGRDNAGRALPAGIYTYRLMAGGAKGTGRVVLLR